MTDTSKDTSKMSSENVERNVNASTATISKKVETHPTTYIEAIMHIFKGNVGPGLFAMGDAFKNGGLIVGTILTFIIAVICVHCEHILVERSKEMCELNDGDELPDYAETVEQCFLFGPTKLRRFSSKMKTIVNIFIVVTQLGFCCIYFVFISTNFQQIFEHYDINLNIRYVMAIVFIPVLIPSLLTKLKFLAPVSSIANFCMISGLIITMYFAFKDGFPNLNDRDYYTNGQQLALYFGTTIFAFEGIALVIPIRMSMIDKQSFEKCFGVLNIGMTAVSFSFIFAGFFGYLKWGDEVGGSLTLNVDGSNWLGLYVKIAVSLGVLFGYPLQFFIAIQIMFPAIKQIFRVQKQPVCSELIFRFLMVLLTFSIAQLVPKLNIFISFIGALCSTALALVFPPLIELISKSGNANKGPGLIIFIKNILILILALLGFTTGSYESISQLIRAYQK